MNNIMIQRCPGLYCGRVYYENESWSDCGACPRGFRTNSSSICHPCDSEPKLYDWMYLGFMALLPLIMHWFCIDLVAKRRSFSIEVFVLHLSSLFEVAIAAILTILWVDPVWSMRIKSCGVTRLADWYTLLHNPTPNYEKSLHCTQEAVYPLHTMGFVFYGLCIISMLSIRPYLCRRYLPHTGKMAIYYALYFFPILALLHAVAGGLIYYAFPYITIILSVVSNATHFSFKLDQSMKDLIRSSLTDLRNAIIIVGHWIILAYGLLALTLDKGIQQPFILLTLVPLPALFYILTSKFTDPNKIHTD